ncbi:hypothetical protein EV356DRAFT_500641 [Viridothelium virens]|uniref:Uncharacterized protein n=1 Tax=Viridothelium virens TaxID=1048519 RepID=A0A6A6HC28_VIRVR|nr:hypothetical protein EV356DRAFT_500641 [Viridothelium virens]
MSPIARSMVQFTQRIRNQDVRDKTLKLIEQATQSPELAHFTKAIRRSPSHTSHTDSRPHATVRFATDAQNAAGKAQTAHLYYDDNWNHASHTLYPEREEKKDDE